MAFSMNRVTLLGRCSQDPELRYTADGTPVCTVSIATSHSYRQGEEWKEVPEFSRCVLWRKAAEYVAQNVAKGGYIYVDGRIQTRKWEDRDGNTRYSTEIVVQNYVIPKGKGEAAGLVNNQASVQTSGDAKPQSEDIPTDDIPF
ncbi:single-stranded DNA-binding protein [Patescibacteria group bacterium]|nr:single-stranded DNA-binding protein [Patescibacteria group bacterium]